MNMQKQELIAGLLVVTIISLASASVGGLVVSSLVQPATTTNDGTAQFTIEAFYTGYVGQSKSIESQINPDIIVPVGTEITIRLIAGEVRVHNFVVDEFYQGEEESKVSTGGSELPTEVTFSFVVDQEGIFTYYCSIPGHFATMNGRLVVGDAELDLPGNPLSTTVDSIIHHPSDLPAPVGVRPAQDLSFTLVTEEVIAEVEEGTTTTFWTFNGSIPGPMIRVREGDNVAIHLTNPASSENTHSVDFHAVTDLGGGAHYTQSEPGETKSFSFNASHLGVFIYHCASPHVPTHISLGMFGIISVEPAEGLPEVDKEFYVGQSELYSKWRLGTQGHQEFDAEKLYNEEPTYVTFNGAAFGLMDPQYALNASLDDNIRIFFGVGGPNLISSFHIIGEVFDKVYYENSRSANMFDAETVLVAPGSALMIEMQTEVKGQFLLVDHALSRAFDKGAIGYLNVQ